MVTNPRNKLVAEPSLRLTILVAILVLQAAIVAAQSPPPAKKPLSATSKPTEGVRFPGDGGVLNVIDFGAVPNDAEDDTSAIQAALDKHPNGNRIVYLPASEYIVTDTLRWADGPRSGTKQKRTILQGQGRDLTKIRVPDGTAGFNGEKNSSKAVIWTGSRPAQRFRNAIRDQGWDNTIPAFLIEDSTVNLCGLNERNFNRRPCEFWFQEIVDGEERTRKDRAWVYLSR